MTPLKEFNQVYKPLFEAKMTKLGIKNDSIYEYILCGGMRRNFFTSYFLNDEDKHQLMKDYTKICRTYNNPYNYFFFEWLPFLADYNEVLKGIRAEIVILENDEYDRLEAWIYFNCDECKKYINHRRIDWNTLNEDTELDNYIYDMIESNNMECDFCEAKDKYYRKEIK